VQDNKYVPSLPWWDPATAGVITCVPDSRAEAVQEMATTMEQESVSASSGSVGAEVATADMGDAISDSTVSDHGIKCSHDDVYLAPCWHEFIPHNEQHTVIFCYMPQVCSTYTVMQYVRAYCRMAMTDANLQSVG